MSELSAQCDELRAMSVSVGLEVPQAATLMMEAADAILSLRDRAQDLQAENARLISVLHEVEAEAVDAYICLQHDCELLTAELENRFRKHWHEQCENAKLRELCTALYRCRDKVSECGTCEDVACPLMHDCRLHDRMRELGVSQ